MTLLSSDNATCRERPFDYASLCALFLLARREGRMNERRNEQREQKDEISPMACPRILKEGARPASLPRRKWRFAVGETGVENGREKKSEIHRHVRTYTSEEEER